MGRKILIGVFIVLIVGLVGLSLQQAGLHSRAKEKEASLVQDPIKATNFVLPGMDGRKYDLIKKGKPTIIHFWTSWCGSCKVEFPLLQKKYERYKDDVQFQMVNLTVEDNPVEVRKLVRKANYRFPVLFDLSGEVGDVYQVVSIPTTYFVDQKGVIQKKVIGVMTEKQFDKMVSLIKE